MNRGTKYGLLLIALMILGTTGWLTLAIIPSVATLRILDENTENGISGAIAKLDWYEPFHSKDTWDYSIQSDSSGNAERSVAVGYYTVEITHPNYQTKREESIRFNEREQIFTFFLTPSGQTPSGKKATFILRDPRNIPVPRGKATFEGEDYMATADGKIIIFSVDPGSHQIKFSGDYKVSAMNFEPFSFTTQFSMPTRDAVFTVWVEQGVIEQGTPPPPPVDYTNLYLLLIGVGVIGFLGFVFLFHGRGPELLGRRS